MSDGKLSDFLKIKFGYIRCVKGPKNRLTGVGDARNWLMTLVDYILFSLLGICAVLLILVLWLGTPSRHPELRSKRWAVHVPNKYLPPIINWLRWLPGNLYISGKQLLLICHVNRRNRFADFPSPWHAHDSSGLRSKKLGSLTSAIAFHLDS